MPKHGRSRFFLEQGLFNDLSCFAELETRIANLSTTNAKGDAFEVFAEAYLASQKIVQAKEVWPFEVIPEKLKRQFSLGAGRDMGVDGLLQTSTDEYSAYQVKYRTGRSSLTWDELSTFMGLTDQVSERILFTNSNSIPKVMDERTGFFCIRGNDLDQLERRDFETIVKWLQSGVIEVKPKEPLPHQGEALEDILPALELEDRATAIMACGTGKTLVALWVAERMDCQNVLVLVPSLALVRQTLHEWLRETHWSNLAYMCVCSDPTVSKGVDDLIVNQADLDFPITTDSDTARQFLSKRFTGTKIVFSTYQSAHILAEAIDGEWQFDLAIFDEAHKTAGKEGTRFAFALSDKNLSIRKRLFLTATPRHYDVRKKDKEGDLKSVYSMDVPETYGSVVHTLPFPKAAREKIICDYKVVISVVTSEMVTEELLRRGEVIVAGDTVKARQVANQIALQEAVEKYGVAQVFTFHSSVKSAQSFVAKGGEGIKSHLPEFGAFHVNGKMRTSEREAVMKEFEDAKKAVMSNARCLTEGVDVPAVDMVAFMSPKKSKVDIVQATGRAMRIPRDQAPDKSIGYILVPLFLKQDKGESVEEAVQRTEFDEIWNILQAMKEHDEVLADIIRRIKEDKGRTGGYDDSRFREKIEILAPDISLKSLREGITALCVEQLGDTWDERYGELKQYKETNGDCNVPQRYPENPQLGVWVANQRTRKIDGKLSEDRIRRLGELGFEWDSRETKWENMLLELKQYKKAKGNCNVPARYPENPQLGVWVTNQRSIKSRGKHTEDRIRRLEELGFEWSQLDEQWEKRFAELITFKETHGHCNVSDRYPENPQLGVWVTNQRSIKSRGKHTEDRIRRLEELGFEWSQLDEQWEKRFAELITFKETHGHCNVPRTYPENPQLGVWVTNQRTNRSVGKLSEIRIRRLGELGFEWDSRETKWENMLLELKQYKKAKGNCNVPARYPENPQLAEWGNTQRTRKVDGKLSEDRIRRLEELYFEWDPLGAQWENMFTELIKFKEANGHYRVSRTYPENPQLATWVNTQRKTWNAGKLSEDRIRRLEELRFEFDPFSAQWENMLLELKQYKKAKGNCNVPAGYPENPQLGSWVSNLRSSKQGKGTSVLTEDRIRSLEKLGFEWSKLDEKWEKRFAELITFKEVNGHCDVPYAFTENPELRLWVGTQRRHKRYGKLSKDRVRRLNAEGFSWSIKK